MTLIILYLVTFALFLGIDYFGLSYLIKPIFEKHVGGLLLEQFRILPAFLFYAFYIAVVLWFVSLPALAQEKNLLWVFGNAALIGAFAYGTYEFTNLATLKDWAWPIVVADLTWGALLTAVAATGGVWGARMLG